MARVEIVKRERQEPELPLQPWEQSPLGEGHLHLPRYIDGLLQANAKRFTNNVRCAALYGNYDSVQAANFFVTKGVARNVPYKRLSFNACQSAVDTVTNRAASQAPEILAMSSDGDYRQFVRARLATQAIRTEFKRAHHDQIFPRIVQNALVFGFGAATVEREPNGLRIQRVFSPELVADPYENITDGWPHCISHVRYVSKARLMELYPDKAQAIEHAAARSEQTDTGAENVRVDEAWICAQGKTPGKHICCISTCDLVELEDYDYPTPPFVMLPWGMQFQGFYPPSLIDQVMGLQLEINQTLAIAHEAISLYAHPIMLVENSSNVALDHVRQAVPGKIIKYTNTRPDVVAPHVLSPEVYQHIERCYQRIYEIAGINMYAAGAKTLPRYESSKAMRAATEQGEVRHFSFAKACEQYHIDLAHLVCREAAILADEQDYRTRMPRSAFFKDIPWKEINFDVERFSISVDTINKGTESIASKYQDLSELAQLQQLSVAELRRYLLNPDLSRVLRHMTASDEYIDWVIYKLAYEEEYMPVEQFMDHATAFKECVAEYLAGLRLGMSDAAKDNLLNYILELQQVMQEAQQEQMNMQAIAQAQAQQKMMQAPVQMQLPSSNQPGSQI